MKKLTKTQILLLHSDLIYAHGGGDGIRDENLLESAIAAPFQSFGGQSMFPSMTNKCSEKSATFQHNRGFDLTE